MTLPSASFLSCLHRDCPSDLRKAQPPERRAPAGKGGDQGEEEESEDDWEEVEGKKTALLLGLFGSAWSQVTVAILFFCWTEKTQGKAAVL